MKELVLNISDELIELAKKYELKTLNEKIETLREKASRYKFRLLFVGGFSAGKSALVNNLIEKDLLAENQRPETAIPSELIYDIEEFIEAISQDGIQRFSINEAGNISSEKYDYLRWHINSRFLSRNNDCIFVDMPGFNSGISNHNKAILGYSENGSAYVLVIDCAEGTVKRSVESFINEIRSYDKNLAIAITKTDIQLNDTTEAVKQSIKETASDIFGDDVTVVTTSKYDKDAQLKIEEIISNFDRKAIFTNLFAPELSNCAEICLSSLVTYRKSIDLDLSDYDKVIKRHEDAKRELAQKLEQEKVKLDNEMRTSVASNVISDVRDELYRNADYLTECIKKGDNSFNTAINDLIRPILLNSTKEYTESCFSSFIAGLDIDSMNESILSPEGAEKFGTNALSKMKNVSELFSKNSSTAGVIYKSVVGSLAIATSVVAPWLELVILFLPDIISAINSMFGKSKEQELRNQVANQIIPQIIDKITPEVEKSMIVIKDKLIEETEAQFAELLASEEEALIEAIEMRKKQEESINIRVEDVENDIKTVGELIETLSA